MTISGDSPYEFDCRDCGTHVCVWGVEPHEKRCCQCAWLLEQRDLGLLTDAEVRELRDKATGPAPPTDPAL